jgi:hypothetical protein
MGEHKNVKIMLLCSPITQRRGHFNVSKNCDSTSGARVRVARLQNKAFACDKLALGKPHIFFFQLQFLEGFAECVHCSFLQQALLYLQALSDTLYFQILQQVIIVSAMENFV